MATYRGGLGSVRRGRRSPSSSGRYGSQTFKSGSSQYAGQMLEGAVDSSLGVLAAREARKQAEERREQLAVAKMAQEARDDQDALIAAEMNKGLADLQVQRQAEGYMPPEGEIVGSDDPIRPLDAGEQAEITTQLAEAKSEEAAAALELEQETMANATKEQRKQARKSESAFRTVESHRKAMESRDNRVRGMEETEAYRAQGQDISAQIAANRQADKAESAVEKLRAKLDDDGKLYASMMTEVKRDRKEEGLRTSGRRAEDEMEEDARERMFAARAKSGVYRANMEGEIVFDDQKALEIAMSTIPAPTVKPGARYTEEDWANAKRVRYTMPADMMDWKPGTWEAMGLDNATALQMASVGAQQRLRWSREQPVASASGRSEPVDGRSSLGGITGSSAPPASFARDEEEAEQNAQAIAGIASSTMDPDAQPESPEGAGAPTPPGPAPVGPAASPAAPPPPVEPPRQEAPSPEQMPAEASLMDTASDEVGGMIDSYGQWAMENIPGFGPADVQDLADETNLDKIAQAKEAQEAAVTESEGLFSVPRVMRDRKKQDAADVEADFQAERSEKIKEIGESNMAPSAKARALEQYLGNTDTVRYGKEMGEILRHTRRAASQAVKDGATQQEAMEIAQSTFKEQTTMLSQRVAGRKATGKAEEWDAAYEQLNATLSEPKEMGKFMLTTGVPMIVAMAVPGAGLVGTVGRMAAVAYTSTALDAGMQKLENPDGNIDWQGAFIEGASNVMAVPGVDAMRAVAGKAGGKILGRVVSGGFGALAEGLEEGMQTNIGSLLKDGTLSSAAETSVSLALGGIMGAGFGAAMTSTGPMSAKETAKWTKQMETAIRMVRESDPDLMAQIEAGQVDAEQLQARVAEVAPEIEAAIAEQATPKDDATMQAEFEAAAAEQAAEVDYGIADVAEATQGVEQAIARDVALKTSLEQAKPSAEQEVGGRVEGPTEVAPMLPKATWTKVDNDTSETTVNGVRLRVQVNTKGLKLEAADAKETYGKEGEVEAIGLFSPRETLTVGAADLIQVAAGQGRRTGGHELVHFFKLNGLLAKKDWATLSTRYEKQARALAAEADWSKLSAEQKEAYREEAVADALGDYAVRRFGNKDARVPKPLKKVYDTIRGFAMKASGKSEAEFEKILRGEFEKGNARAATQASADRARLTPRASVDPNAGPIAVQQEGWTGVRNRKTGTIGLQGPSGEKVAGKLEGGVFSVKSIGKGSATSSQGLVEAIRNFARQRGAKRVVMSSTQAELTPAAVKWREGMVRRGEALYNEDGQFEITTKPPTRRAQAVKIDAKGRLMDKVAQAKNLAYYLATKARDAGKGANIPGNVGAKDGSVAPTNKPVKVGTTPMGAVSNAQWLARNSEALGGVGSDEWRASQGWYKDLRSAFVKEFGEANADKMLMLWGVSQQRASASKGMSDVFVAEDIAKGFRLEKQAGLASERMVNILSGKAGTLGQKLTDFMDSIRGSLTRSWVGNDARAGQPAAFDVWAQRDIGYVDKRIADWAKKQGVDLEVDFVSAPTDPEYHHGVTRYQEIAKYLNRKSVDGRTDWTAAQAQAIGWMAIQKVVGVTPETVVDVFAKNKAQIAAEARPGATVDPKAQARFDALSKEAQASVTTEVIQRIAPEIAKVTGVRVQQVEGSEGQFEGDVTPNAVLEVLGSADQIQGFTDAMAQVMGQDEVWAIRPNVAANKKNAILIDVKQPDGFNAEQARKLYGEIFGTEGGYTLLPDGTLRTLVPFTNPTATRVAAKQSEIADRLSLFGSATMEAEIGGAEVVIGKGGDHEGPSPRRVDGVEGVSDLANTYSEAYESAIGEAEASRPRARAQVAPKPSALSDTKRRATLPILEQLKKITSDGGRKVGALISKQVSDRQEYMERKLARNRHGYRKALKAFKKLEGKNWPASWDQVVSALDGDGKFKGLNPAQKRMYLVARAIFNTVKTDAISNGTFTGQVIFKYFPHMRTDRTEIDPVQDHADWLRENDPARLESLKEKDSEWMEGILGEASDRELAAKDMNKNWKSERWWKANSHLEKHRGQTDGEIRRDTDVVLDYLDSAYPRIATARYFGPKSEVINEAMSSLQKDSDDFRYVHDSLREILGFGQRRTSLLGRGALSLGREIQTLAGLTKLGMAAIPQLTQVGPAVSEAMRPGLLKGARSVLKGARSVLVGGEALANAERAGSLIAADIQGGSEIQKAQYGAGTGTFTEAAFKKVFSLGGLIPAGERIVTSTYGVVTLDKAARVIADSIGRAVYIDAVKAGDRVMLLDLLGTNEMVDTVLKQDGPIINELEAAWKEGTLDDEQFKSRMARPAEGDPQYVGKNLSLRRGVANMDRAAKRYADKTQYRTRVQDAPLAFQSPMLKWSNTFLSFMYQHWNWQKNHAKAVANTSLSGAERRGHAKTLMVQNLMMAPLLGQLAFSARALLTGRGNDEEDEFATPLEAFDAVMGLDPIKASDKLTLAMRYMQGWQYAGGIGYPTTIIERWRRAAEKSDPYRGLSGLMFGAPGESVFDAAAFSVEATKFAEKWADGRATNADIRRLKRLGWRLTSHTTPNQFGLMGGVRRQAGATETYPNFNPGWLGLFWDPEATWNFQEGVTSPGYRESREDRKYDLEDKKARERERALDDAYDRENPR